MLTVAVRCGVCNSTVWAPYRSTECSLPLWKYCLFNGWWNGWKGPIHTLKLSLNRNSYRTGCIRVIVLFTGDKDWSVTYDQIMIKIVRHTSSQCSPCSRRMWSLIRHKNLKKTLKQPGLKIEVVTTPLGLWSACFILFSCWILCHRFWLSDIVVRTHNEVCLLSADLFSFDKYLS